MGLREEGGDTGKKQWNTKVKTEPRVTQIFIKNFFLSFTIVRFIEILGNGSYVRRRITINLIRD